MRARIVDSENHGISWTLEDPITPDLIAKIRQAGELTQVDWFDSPFSEAVDILLEKWDFAEIEERIYDEDEEIIDFLALIVNNPLFDQSQSLKEVIRLYLPVILILADLKTIEL